MFYAMNVGISKKGIMVEEQWQDSQYDCSFTNFDRNIFPADSSCKK